MAKWCPWLEQCSDKQQATLSMGLRTKPADVLERGRKKAELGPMSTLESSCTRVLSDRTTSWSTGLTALDSCSHRLLWCQPSIRGGENNRAMPTQRRRANSCPPGLSPKWQSGSLSCQETPPASPAALLQFLYLSDVLSEGRGTKSQMALCN